jgi:hypothetical protein
MDPISSGSPNADKVFKFWDTKQGTVMMALGAVAIVGLLYVALPYLLVLFQNLFATLGFMVGSIILAVVVGFLGMIVTNRRFLLALTIWADRLARLALKASIDRDPISAAKHALDRMRKRLEQINTHRRQIVANLKRVEGQIDENAEQAKNEFSLAQQALKQNKQGQAQVHAQTAEEYQKSNLALTPTYQQMRKYAAIFERVGESADIKIQLFERKIAIKEKELAVKKAGQQAADAARSMFSGADDELMQESMDSISDQIAAAEADMEQFMTDIMPTLQADELQHGVDQERGMQSLQKWLEEQNQKPDAQSLLGSGAARTLLLEAEAASPLPAGTDRAPLPASSNFDSFFSNDSDKK